MKIKFVILLLLSNAALAQQTIHITDIHRMTDAEKIPSMSAAGTSYYAHLNGDYVVVGSVLGLDGHSSSIYTLSMDITANLELGKDYLINLRPECGLGIPETKVFSPCGVRGRKESKEQIAGK